LEADLTSQTRSQANSVRSRAILRAASPAIDVRETSASRNPVALFSVS